MAENTLPKKNTAYTFYVALVDTGSRPDLKASATLAAGDVLVSTDGAAFGNLDTLPVVTPASGEAIKVDLSASEMNGDNVTIKFIDAAGAEWDDMLIEIRPATRRAEDLSFPTTSGRGVDTTVGGTVGIDWGNVESPGSTVDLSATDIQLCDTITTYSSNTVQTGDSFVRLGAPAGVSVSADILVMDTNIDDIETDTAAMQPLVAKIPLSDGTISWNATALAAIQTECDSSISSASLATAADLLDKLGAVNEAAAAGDPSATESVMQYVKQIVNVLMGATGIVSMPAAAAPGNNVSIAEMIRSIYDDTNELQGDWVNTGRLDTILDAIPTTAMRGTDSAATAASLATAQLDLDTITGADGVNLLSATQASIDAIELDTGTTLDDHLTDIKGTSFIKDTHSLIDIETYVDILDDATSGNVKIATDVAAVLVDTAVIDVSVGEPAQGAPPVSASPFSKIDYLYKAWRNKIEQTTTTMSVYNNAGTVVDHKATVSDDDVTFTREEVVAGP